MTRTTDLSSLVDGFADLRVVVVGDTVLDAYASGTPQGLCREAPVPVVDVERHEYACGGAANTAVNVAALGARAVLAAVVGEDPDGGRLRRRLQAADIGLRLVPVRGRRTLAKRRLVADGQILLRFDEGDTGPVPPDAARQLVECIEGTVDAGVDAVLVGDYGAGTVDGRVREALAHRRGDIPLLVVDAHDPRPWAAVRPDLVTPSFAEAWRLLDGDDADDDPGPHARPALVAAAADRLLATAGAGAVAVTLDAEGAVVVAAGREPQRTFAKPVPGGRTAGAGDAYAAAFTLALSVGVDLAEAAEVAQLAATAATRAAGTHALGTAACDIDALLATGGAADSCALSAGELVAQVAAHREQGRRIVFTNGCFDVLHRGHVGYLDQARRLGDVLVVAVNSDASVRRLKGPDRPVNAQEDRVAVLAALSSVDHVVVFNEDTPANLIALVRPDVYVKGGDYRPELIPEAPLVRSLGVEVRVLDYLPDRSTSRIIDQIRAAGSGQRRAVSRRQVG
jgi:rfaE bifunctional protein nucleotidyltransferase chain/domain/rfaE bifunctional protein kinase chain/domain